MKTHYLVLFLGLVATACSQEPQQRGNLQMGDYGYLYCHMSDHGQWTAYALSRDGLHYHDLLCGDSIFSAFEMAKIEGGTRDAYLCRKVDGSGYLMVTTDMNNSMTKRMNKGGEWENFGIDLLTSDDLIHWQSTSFDFRKGLSIFCDGDDTTNPAYKDFSTICRVWAPQIIWDGDYRWADGTKGGYMIYYSLLNRPEEDYDRMYYSHADRTFTRLTQPRVLIDWGYATIDADINWLDTDQQYHLMIKKEGGQPGLFTSASPSLLGPWPEPDDKDFVNFEGNKMCEGVSAFQIAGEDGWRIGYIEYSSNPKNYRICKADANMRNFSEPRNIEGVNGPQHGSFLRLTKEEYDRLEAWSDSQIAQHLAPDVNNPVIPGLFADPEILYSEKTRQYYLYPTTDGSEGWHNHDFRVYSSPDLRSWHDEGVILDLKTDVTWADEYAWAPCIIEKRVEGSKGSKGSKGYKYFYYFVANKSIGVAVADNPTGPFTDALGKPLLTREETNAPGDVIDPDVFQDPKTGKYYLYWGNSFLACAELADDMVSLVPSTTRYLIPRDEKDNYHYSEGTYVFYRKGLYYFMWSEGITRSALYQVRYLISDSPTEFVRNGQPAQVESQVVLKQNPRLQIFGTGHHSVICEPGTDRWHIIYHRFARPDAIKLGLSAGYNREVCIDDMEFNADGTIKPVVVTL